MEFQGHVSYVFYEGMFTFQPKTVESIHQSKLYVIK